MFSFSRTSPWKYDAGLAAPIQGGATLLARASVDGMAFKGEKLFNLVIKNAMVYAGSFILSRDIRGNDDLLEVFLYTNAESYTSELGTHVLKMVPKLDPTGLSTGIVDLAVRNSEYKKGTVIEVRTDRKIDLKSMVNAIASRGP